AAAFGDDRVTRSHPQSLLNGIDTETAGRFAARVNFPHPREGSLDMALVALRIEQRAGEAIFSQPGPEGGEKLGFSRQSQSKSFVLVGRSCNQLGKAHGGEQACPDASGKG